MSLWTEGLEDDAVKFKAPAGRPVRSSGLHTDGLQSVQRGTSATMGTEEFQW